MYGYHGQEEPTSFHHINAEGRASGHDGVSEDASPKGMAMQGMLSDGNSEAGVDFGEIASAAGKYADALLAEYARRWPEAVKP